MSKETSKASEAAKAEEKSKQNYSKVFVLKAKPTGLKSAENFLKNRTWDLISSTDMKTALATLFRNNMDYALIGVDHPHPHVLKLPEIIAQTIKIPVILFAENLSPQAAQVLRTAKTPYILFPPVSGPAIERMLLRIEKDKQNAANAKLNEGKTADAVAESHANIRVGEGASAGSDIAQISGTYSMDDIAKLFEGDSQSAMMTANQAGAGMGAAMSQMQQGFGTGTAKSVMQAGHGSGQPMSSGLDTADAPASADHPHSHTDNGEKHAAQAQAARHASTIDLSLWPQGPSRARNQKDDEGDGKVLSLAVSDVGSYDRQIPHQSIFINGTEHALAKSSQLATDAPEPAPLAKNSNVGCFSVQSAEVAGVIVVAFGNDLEIDDKFSNDLQNHLVIYMQENGIQLSIDDMLSLKIQQVEFEDWSQKEAVFLRKSIHAGKELALAFFINDEDHVPLEASMHNHMLKVNIDEIRTENSLEFDVYLYFPENQKYIRYVGKDGNLSNNQWNRLTASGVTEVHVKKEAEGDYSKYRMKNFLNDKISTYNIRKKTF